MKENIETKDVQRTEYLDKNGLDMLWANVKENTRNQVEAERDRAITQENRIIDTKADKSELHSSYVSNSTFTALQEKVAANTDAIRDKQDTGNYLSYKTLNNEGYYEIPDIRIPGSGGITKTDIDSQSISVNCDYPASHTTITCDGISNTDNNANHVYATDGSIADLTQYAKKTDIPEVDTSDFVSKTTTDAQSLKSELSVSNVLNVIGSSRSEPIVMLGTNDIKPYLVMINPENEKQVIQVTPTHIQIGEHLEDSIVISNYGIQSPDNNLQHVFTTAGSTADLFEYVRKENIGDGLNINDDGIISVDTTAISGGNVDDVQVNGVTVVENKIANIKPATKESLGVVKVGDGLSVTDGVISVDSKLFALDMVSYGVEWDTTVADPACTRIGNPLLHKQLPIQSEYKGCLVKNGKVNYYLDPNDWSKKADGTPSVLDGTDGDIMVHIPKFYGKSGSNVNKRWVRISTTQVDSSWVEIPEMFVSAYRITTFDDSGTPKIASVVNTTANYRGGLNRVNYDQHLDTDKFKTDLGKPRTGVSREKMRTMATNSGQELLCYEFYKWIFYWAYVIEYANFNSQKEFNSELTSDGYHQGGLGSGLTTLNYQKWGSYNGHNPITPCGYTNEFGNFSGEEITYLKLDSEQTVTAIHINRWRGFENPFGDIYTNLDGIVLERDAPSSDSNVYTTSDSSKFGDDTSVMTIVGSEPNSNGIIGEFDLGETGEIIPQYTVNSALKYKCDYHICDISTSTNKRTLKVGGCASNANDAGLCNLDTSDTANATSSFVGFRSVIRA